jgi:protein-S-isoprenylcysteine O-methyltransferase Ste14
MNRIAFPLVGALWILWSAYWILRAIRGNKRTVRSESLGSMVLQRSLLLPGYLLLFIPIHAFGLGTRLIPATPFWAVLGVALCVFGLGHTLWARAILGTNWSANVTLKQDHELIQGGPYAWTRHPIYTGLITASLGAALVAGSLRGALGLALIIASFHLKMANEEGFMRERFGDAYRDYSRRVKKLVPCLY